MKLTQDLYKTSLALLTDLYQLTMAYGYWKHEKMNQEAVFNLFFRKNPFNGGFTVACGLEYVIDFIKHFSFDPSDLAYLASLEGTNGKPLFDPAFIEELGNMRLILDIDAVPEGTVMFPHEPLIRVQGPLFQCQLLETALLNIVNFQTLIATKSARVCLAAAGDPVLEFGMRRAHGIDGSLAASRAAFIGGCAATSNVLAGKLFSIPVKGTHAHSWVMSFHSEEAAFEAWNQAMPHNSILLVDTYNTLSGVRQAIVSGKKLRGMGYELSGIRLDSGDLAYLSIEARQMLDEAGFPQAKIIASGDLDEYIITSLKNEQDAKIDIWGVGTKLATAFDQPALGGVYKLSAIRMSDGTWEHKVKLSEQAEKTSNPGIQQVKRFYNNGIAVADMIYDELEALPAHPLIIDPKDSTRRKKLSLSTENEDLLVPIFRSGELVYKLPTIFEAKALTEQQLAKQHRTIKRFTNPHIYPVGLEKGLFQRKNELILGLRNTH